MGFISHNKKSPYYRIRPNENIIEYLKRVIRSIIAMYPYARVYGIRYYVDTNFRRKLSYRRKQRRDQTIRRSREGTFRKSSVKSKLKTSLINRDGLICNFCKVAFIREDLTIDHIIPLFMGAKSTELRNLQLLCCLCHVQKSKDDECFFR